MTLLVHGPAFNANATNTRQMQASCSFGQEGRFLVLPRLLEAVRLGYIR